MTAIKLMTTPMTAMTAIAFCLGVAAGCASQSGGAGTGGASGARGSGGTGQGGSSGGTSSGGAGARGGSGAVGAGSGGAISSGGAGLGTGGSGASASGGGSGAAGGSGSGAVGGAVGACPANATFCSGFEENVLPAGAVYRVNAAPGDWTRDYAVDSTMHNRGTSSLRVKSSTEAGTSGSMYKMLAVPAPMASFWVRFYLRSEIDLGGLSHNAFAEASGSDDPNDGVAVEFAEDVGLAFNSKDDVRWPMSYGRATTGATNPFTLPKDAWHCIELSYDSQTRNQKLFINGTQQIDAANYPVASQPPAVFSVFKFGFMELHGPPRKLWYDDVAVAPQRIPCF